MPAESRAARNDMPGAAPLVTVCVPTVGRAAYFTETIACVRAQTYPNVEVLILDNGSPAEWSRTLADHTRALANARVLRSAERLPMFANFNRGVRAARGEYVTFFHDDDTYLPEFLEHHVALLEMWASAGFAAGNFDIMDETGRVVRRKRDIRETELWSGRRFIVETLGRGRNVLATPGIVFRRAALADGGFHEGIPPNWGDLVILSRIAEHFDVAVSASVLYRWRVHRGNNSRMPFSRSIPLRDEIIAGYLTGFGERHPDTAALCEELGRRRIRMRRSGLVWGWLEADSRVEADACLQELGRMQLAGVWKTALSIVRHLRLPVALRRLLLPVARRVGSALGA